MKRLLFSIVCSSLICASLQTHHTSLAQRQELADHIDGVKNETTKQIEKVIRLIELSENRTKQKLDMILEVCNKETTEQTAEKLEQIYNVLHRHLEPELFGKKETNPAKSCRDVLEESPDSLSGEYWIETKSRGVEKMYCDMNMTCGGITGGWMQIAHTDMDNLQDSCPKGLSLFTSPRRCGKPTDDAGCGSAMFDVRDIKYKKVCGRVIGYQLARTMGFYPYHSKRYTTIDEGYVDGVSLTCGTSQRNHIWTFAATHKEGVVSYAVCPCTQSANSDSVIPPFVGSDYFCDTAIRVTGTPLHKVYTEDPLWDGDGCGRYSRCCSIKGVPWFMKELNATTTDDIEMRICLLQDKSFGDVTLKSIELYVQ